MRAIKNHLSLFGTAHHSDTLQFLSNFGFFQHNTEAVTAGYAVLEMVSEYKSCEAIKSNETRFSEQEIDASFHANESTQRVLERTIRTPTNTT